MPIDLRFDPDEVALMTDLYELTMAASYFALGYNQPACFDLSVRRMPSRRGFLVAAGLERLLEALEAFRFTPDALDYLASLQLFTPDFLNFLGTLRFTGEIYALPEGTIFFGEEPLLEVRAPLIEAQLIETLVINQIGMASLIASKAARCVIAADGRRLVDFGLRRSHGVDAGLIAARSSYLTGFIGTSNVLAGRRYGIPVYGTMAHSYVMAHDREREAFEHFVAMFPQLSTLLVDTYDTVRGIGNAAQAARGLKDRGGRLQAIRIDSGDLADLAGRARRILDQHGLQDVPIFASGNLDENKIQALLRSGAPIDAFGVGTEMDVSADAPSLDIAYKLSEYDGIPRIKTSLGKLTLPGRKQVFRAMNQAGGFYADLIGLADESAGTAAREFKPAPAEASGLLIRQFANDHRLEPRPTLDDSREHWRRSLSQLEQRYQDLERPAVYPVRYTAALSAMLTNEKLRAERRQA
ncbi:MAG TPA: nicotinate phosphoribosyltransferase [Candidatus Binataceae bacterium]|nr:nicotinate phosphoribosyltransferase [Candidatus Binataceae bacterium]